ncbi:hypothetical protein ACIGXM_30410 [Kitasatospora sp. NPDC052896]|uniref:hypothetical protein n=1 Tax=Kitasatospora sp. NPDC052896 TaxID=3364061 RepID=UPI0037C50D50
MRKQSLGLVRSAGPCELAKDFDPTGTAVRDRRSGLARGGSGERDGPTVVERQGPARLRRGAAADHGLRSRRSP